MTVRDVVVAAVRTAVQVVVAAAVTWATPILDWVADQGVTVDRSALEAGAFAVLVAVVTGLVNEAGRRWPWINRILSLGLDTNPPSYR